jgi:hypothetical protein
MKPPHREVAAILPPPESSLLVFLQYVVLDTLSPSAPAHDERAIYLHRVSSTVADPYRAMESHSSNVHLAL